jgi:hypothetical protein
VDTAVGGYRGADFDWQRLTAGRCVEALCVDGAADETIGDLLSGQIVSQRTGVEHGGDFGACAEEQACQRTKVARAADRKVEAQTHARMAEVRRPGQLGR